MFGRRERLAAELRPGRRHLLRAAAATLLPAVHGYDRYMGSLTMPPCTQGIVWTRPQQPIEAHRVQGHTAYLPFHTSADGFSTCAQRVSVVGIARDVDEFLATVRAA